MDKPAKKPGDYPRRVQEGTRQLVHELLAEVGKARALSATLRSDKQLLEEEVAALRDELRRVREERGRLEGELAEIASKNQRYADEFTAIEAQHSNLASLYVASYRLHETLSRQVLLDTIQEIVANLVGSEQLAVLELDESGTELVLCEAYGIDRGPLERIPVAAGVIGRTARTGELWVVADEPDDRLLPEESDLTACIPLRLEGEVTGVIAVFRLLPQKSKLEELDYELFDLLGLHAAMALYCTKLHGRAG
jgi:hypothetical protein